MWNYKKVLQKQKDAESKANKTMSKYQKDAESKLNKTISKYTSAITMNEFMARDVADSSDANPSIQELMKLRSDVLARALELNGYELITDDSPENLRKVIESAGNQIGSVHFIKRSTGELRKMSYRLHVTNPRYAKKPMGKKVIDDVANTQMTVFDTNKVIKDKETGEVIGRGAWRTIPLENVVRITAGGKTYLILPRYESEDQEVIREFFYI